MVDIIPKITDVSSLKAISAILALPLLCVAYIFQTGAEIGWDGSIWFGVNEDLTQQAQLNRLLLIFVFKSVWVSLFAVIGYGFLAYGQASINFPLLQLISIVLLAFGLLGVFGAEQFPQLKLISPFWFYSCFVWGMFLHAMREQIDSGT